MPPLSPVRRILTVTCCAFLALVVAPPVPADTVDAPDDAEGTMSLALPTEHEDGPDLEVGKVGGMDAGPDGTMYVSDQARDHIYAIEPDGEVSTVAGTGEGEGDRGDDGPATEAHLNTPGGVAVTDDGTIYVGVPYESAIRAIDSEGTITTPFTDEEEWDNIADVHLGTDGDDVYFSVEGEGIYRLTSDGETERIGEDDAETVRGLEVRDGTVYVGTGDAVHTVRDDALEPVVEDWGDVSDAPNAGDIMFDGDVMYIAGENGLLRHDEGVSPVPSPAMEHAAFDGQGDLYFTVGEDSHEVWRLNDPHGQESVDLPDTADPGSVDQSLSATAGTVSSGTSYSDPNNELEWLSDLAIGESGELFSTGSGGLWDEQSSQMRPAPPGREATHVEAAEDDTLLYVQDYRLYQSFADGSVTPLTSSEVSVHAVAAAPDTVVIGSGTDLFLLDGDRSLSHIADVGAFITDVGVASDGTFVAVDRDNQVTRTSQDGETETIAELPTDGGEFESTSLAAAGDGTVFVSGNFEHNPDVDYPEDSNIGSTGAILRVPPDGTVGTIAMESDEDPEPDERDQALNTRLEEPRGLALDGDGHLHFLDDDESYAISDAVNAPQREPENTMPGSEASSTMLTATVFAVAIAGAVLWYVHSRSRAVGGRATTSGTAETP